MGKIRLKKDQKKCVCLFCGRLGQDLVGLIQCQTNRDPHGCMETPYNLSGKDSLQNYIHFLSSIHCSQRALILRK